MICEDCNDTGYGENRVEGKFVCACIAESQPYIKLKEQYDRLGPAIEACRPVIEKVAEWATPESELRRAALSAGSHLMYIKTMPTTNQQNEALTQFRHQWDADIDNWKCGEELDFCTVEPNDCPHNKPMSGADWVDELGRFWEKYDA